MESMNIVVLFMLAAIAVSVSVLPIVTVILILLSENSVKNGFGYLIGWIIGLSFVTTISFSLIDNFADAPSRPEQGPTILIKILLGIVFVLMARHLWHSRPESSEEAPQSKVFEIIDKLTFPRALLLGFLLMVANMKNLFLVFISTYTLAELDIDASIQMILLTVFIGFSSLTILIPVIFNAAMGEKIKPSLHKLKDWLLINNKAVLAVMMFAGGSLLIVQNLLKVIF